MPTIADTTTAPDDTTYMTPGQVAALYHTSPKTVTRWVNAGRLHALYTPGGQRLFKRSEVNRLLSRTPPVGNITPASEGGTVGPALTEVGRIRAWAQANGIRVSQRGRIAQTVYDAYAAAQGTPQATQQGATETDEPIESVRRVQESLAAAEEAIAEAAGPVSEPARIRAWAAANGIEVSARGRIPAAVREEFRAAMEAVENPDMATVRAWANSNGIEVSPRGRVAARVVEQYKAAHQF